MAPKSYGVPDTAMGVIVIVATSSTPSIAARRCRSWSTRGGSRVKSAELTTT